MIHPNRSYVDVRGKKLVLLPAQLVHCHFELLSMRRNHLKAACRCFFNFHYPHHYDITTRLLQLSIRG